MEKKQTSEEVIQLIRELDWLTTKEFCDKYKIEVPSWKGNVELAAFEFIRLDAIKWNMAKDLVKHGESTLIPKKSPPVTGTAEEMAHQNFIDRILDEDGEYLKDTGIPLDEYMDHGKLHWYKEGAKFGYQLQSTTIERLTEALNEIVKTLVGSAPDGVQASNIAREALASIKK